MDKRYIKFLKDWIIAEQGEIWEIYYIERSKDITFVKIRCVSKPKQNSINTALDKLLEYVTFVSELEIKIDGYNE